MTEEGEYIPPSPAAMAFATKLTEAEFRDVEQLAFLIDGVAQEARDNERARIFRMGFAELFMEFWKGKKLHVK